MEKYFQYLKTGDHYSKVLLTLDMNLEADYEGITKIKIIDWLLKEERE